MPSVCMYFQVHQPYRLRPFSFFDIGNREVYEDEEKNRTLLDRVADNCYLPANELLLALLDRHRGDFRIAFSLTGIVLEQMERYRPDVLASFQRLAATGCVEFLGETYFHSLAFLFSRSEFEEQVRLQEEKIRRLFGYQPAVFRCTELIYSDKLAVLAKEMGYRAMLAEGADTVLKNRSPDFLYQAPGPAGITLLLKNYRLSDDIAFRFSDPHWSEYPLGADRFARWLHERKGSDVINLFLDYETFGEHQGRETGIFDFLTELPAAVLKKESFTFRTPSDLLRNYAPVGQLAAPDPISWADCSRDLTAWLGNAMQRDAIHTLREMEETVKRTNNPALVHTWRTLQTSDHFYYMSTKLFADGMVHEYFNPYGSPYDAYINYMNVLDDFSRRLGKGTQRGVKKAPRIGAA